LAIIAACLRCRRRATAEWRIALRASALHGCPCSSPPGSKDVSAYLHAATNPEDDTSFQVCTQDPASGEESGRSSTLLTVPPPAG